MVASGRKISTSQNYAIWVKDLLDNYEADSIRYFFIANGPEKKDADFFHALALNAQKAMKENVLATLKVFGNIV